MIDKTDGGILITRIKQLQGRILFVLWEKDGIPISELARKTGLAKTTLICALETGLHKWKLA